MELCFNLPRTFHTSSINPIFVQMITSIRRTNFDRSVRPVDDATRVESTQNVVLGFSLPPACPA